MAQPQPGPAIPPSGLAERTAATAPGPAPAADVHARDAAQPARPRFPQRIAALGAATIVAGLFLAIAPFLFDYVADGAGINAIVCGAIAVFLGVLRVGGVRHPAVGYVQVALGGWIVASGVLLADLARETWIACSLGVMIFFLGLLGVSRMPDSAVADHEPSRLTS